MAKTKAEQWADVHAEAKFEFTRAYAPQQAVRLECLQDRRFCYVPGAMWEGSLEMQFENRPRFEVNKLQQAVIRIFSEYRNNRISVMFRPSDKSATADDADMVAGLYRSDEDYSTAQEAYDNAFEEAVSGGFGAWRLRAKYEDEGDEEDDRQRICMEPIYDADASVFFDVDAKRQDKDDATRCWILYSITKGDYEDQYGPTPSSFATVQKLTEFDWYKPDVVYLAEYYKVEEKAETVSVMLLEATGDEQVVRSGFTAESRADAQDQIDELMKQGYIKARERKVTKKRVRKYLMDGQGILEDYGYIAGSNIPVIPVYGKRGFVDNVERIQGHIRTGKDSQKLFNMQVSTLADISAMSPRQKPIFTPEQIRGHEVRWAEDNVKNYPYLLLNPVRGQDGNLVAMGPVGSVTPPAIPQALAALIQQTSADIQELTGGQAAAEQVQSNVSAKTVEMVQNRLDMQTFIYMDNMSKAMRRCGEIWLAMAKELYDEEGRDMRVLDQAGEESTITLNQPGVDKQGQMTTMNNMAGKFDVRVDVGPSFSSRRDSTVRALVGVLQFVNDPQEASIITTYILNNIDGEGLQDLRDFMRKKLINMGVVQPTDDEKAELQAEQEAAANQPPDAQTVALTAQARDFNAAATLKEAQTVKAMADADFSHANAAKALSDVQLGQLSQIIDMLQAITAADQQRAAVVDNAVPPTPNGPQAQVAAATGNVSPAPPGAQTLT